MIFLIIWFHENNVNDIYLILSASIPDNFKLKKAVCWLYPFIHLLSLFASPHVIQNQLLSFLLEIQCRICMLGLGPISAAPVDQAFVNVGGLGEEAHVCVFLVDRGSAICDRFVEQEALGFNHGLADLWCPLTIVLLLLIELARPLVFLSFKGCFFQNDCLSDDGKNEQVFENLHDAVEPDAEVSENQEGGTLVRKVDGNAIYEAIKHIQVVENWFYPL